MNTEEMTVKELQDLQEKHRKQIKDNKEKVMQRKKRTHRLIVRGAIVEKIIPDVETMSDEEFQQYLYNLIYTKC